MKHKLKEENAQTVGETNRRGLDLGWALRPYQKAWSLSGGHMGATIDSKQGSDTSLWI